MSRIETLDMTLRTLSRIAAIIALVTGTACREDFALSALEGPLAFSRDTVFLDTVFQGIASPTYSLTVYNPTGKDVAIPGIRLDRGETSPFRLNVDGLPGKSFESVPLLAGDSLLVYIEVTATPEFAEGANFLETDRILFQGSSGDQSVELVSLVKDAIFLYPPRDGSGAWAQVPIGIDGLEGGASIEGFPIRGDTLAMGSERPYVIYGYGVVESGNTLRVAAGARLHFHANSGLIVRPGGRIDFQGAVSPQPEGPGRIVLEGDRLDPGRAEDPGQWGTIWIQSGSVDNRIENTTLRNASAGILVDGVPESDTPALRLSGVRIENSALVNLWSRSAYLTVSNSILGPAGTYAFYGQSGGRYRFVHTTIANYWERGFRGGPALFLDDFQEDSDASGPSLPLIEALFENCIVTGNRPLEIGFSSDSNASFPFRFTHCLLTAQDVSGALAGDSLYDFNDTDRYEALIRNLSADFTAPFDGDFSLSAGSPCIDAGDPSLLPLFPFDARGKARDALPDLGALESE